MNVLMLAPEFFPVWGGVGSYILEISRNMPNDVEIHIITPRRTNFGTDNLKSSDESNNPLPDNVHVHFVGSAKDTFFYNLFFQLNCRKFIHEYINKFKIDLIHSQSAMPDIFISEKKN
jgi:glycosyltransferase involved in cell wall biosynthesis